MLDSLSQILSPDQIRTDAESIKIYGKDWLKQFEAKAQAIVFPKTTEEVQKLVLWARKTKTALIPSGGRTGLSGAAVALKNEVVVSFEKMNRILDINETDRIVHLEPGVITETLQNYLWEKGHYYPVDFAARGSSQMGGNIATNAGGVKVLRYGLTRDQVASLEVVTATGEILNLGNDLVKNATGLDLRHLFIGSEGILGFITKIGIKYTHQPKPLTVLLLALPDLSAVMKVFEKFRVLPLTAFEFFSDIALDVVKEYTHLDFPLETAAPNYLLIEVENTDASVSDDILKAFEACSEENLVLDGTIAQNETQAKTFWRFREDISEATAPYSPYKNDVSVKVSLVPQFLKQVDDILKSNYPTFKVVWFGHIGDGNMHINILKPKDLSKEDFLKRCAHVNDLLFKVIGEMRGSVSAEHGVGLTKKDYLQYSKSAAEISLMKQIKAVFDPDNIMNPGKVI
jgi:glycolate oxidase subunit GlcD